MILRKPYAFLIKHFKLIHFILSICVCFTLIKTWGILSFFNEFISNNQIVSTFEDVSSMYVSTLFFVVVFSIIVVLAVILYLMRHKKKPCVFYIYSLIYYSILLILLLYVSSFIYDVQFFTPDLRITKLLKDIFLAVFILQIPILVLAIIRTLGFDIKKFDFKQDLMDFDISNEDNEEFELQLGVDSEAVKARFRKRIRYFKYYYKENKIIFFCGFVIILLLVVVNVTNYVLSIEKVYKEQEMFETSKLKITVLDSYKTKLDYKGELINNKKFYLILKMRYTNKSNQKLNIYLDYARVNYTKYDSVVPTKLVYKKFLEFGVPYYSQFLNPKETRDFILVYEIPNEFYDADFVLKYLYDIEVVNNISNHKYRVIDINPETVDNFDGEIVDAKKLGEELTFKGSLLGDSKLVINNVDFSNKYSYVVTRCNNVECEDFYNFLQPSINNQYGLTLMRIEYSMNYDKRLGQGYSLSSFIADFGSIRIVANGTEIKKEIKDITPYPTKGYTYVEVTERIHLAEKIYLDFTIRDKKYTYVLKDSTPVEKEEVSS